MSKPKLSIAFSNGNIAKDIQNIDGFAAIIGTAQQVANQDKLIIVHNLSEAIQAGITLADEPFAYRQISEFYGELAGNQSLYLLFVPNTVTMAQMLDSTSNVYANKLIEAAGGNIGKLGVFRTPPPNYVAGTNFIDSDVTAAVTAAKSFVQTLNNKLKFVRVLIEGRIADETSTVIFNPNTANNGFAGVVLGGTKPDLSASIGLALGRSVKYPCHIKLGKVANGALSVNKIYIGTKELNGLDAIVVAPIAEVKATGTTTITAIGADNDYIYIYAPEPNGGWTYLGLYAKTSGDTTVTNIATGLKNAINTNTSVHGYTATSAAGVVTVTSKAGLGASNNGIQLSVTVNGGITFSKTAFANGVDAKDGQTYQTDTLHNAGYLSFLTYPGKAGFYFGIDNMASDDDYRNLVHGAVVDAVAKVIASVYIDELEGEVDTNADGTIKEIDAQHLEDRAKHQVQVTLGERISAIEIVVDRTSNIIDTSKTKIKGRVRPVGYNTFIEFDLGLTAGN